MTYQSRCWVHQDQSCPAVFVLFAWQETIVLKIRLVVALLLLLLLLLLTQQCAFEF
jgi:hypothetical protein